MQSTLPPPPVNGLPPPPAHPVGPYHPPPPYSFSPPPPIANQQGPRGSHHGRGARNDRQSRGRSHRQHSRGQRHPSPQRSNSSRRDRQSSMAADSKSITPTSTSTPLERLDTKAEDRKTDAKEEREVDDDSEWQFTAIFAELKTAPADPVGHPLPTEWNDNPTIPPAFNAKVILSEFFKEDNIVEFCKSIRNDPHWTRAKLDPAFKHRHGMVLRQFAGSEHIYPVYRCENTDFSPISTDLDSAGEVRSDWHNDPWSPRANRRREKRNSDLGHTLLPDESQVEVGRDPWSTQPRNNSSEMNRTMTSKHLGKRTYDNGTRPDQRGDKRPRLSGSRMDSEQRSRRSDADNATKENRHRQQHTTDYSSGQGSHAGRHKSPERLHSEARHRYSRSPSPARGRRNNRSRDEQATSRGQSEHAAKSSQSTTRSSSPLDELELEMLGMSQPAEFVTKKKPGLTTQTPKARRAPMANAFRYVNCGSIF